MMLEVMSIPHPMSPGKSKLQQGDTTTALGEEPKARTLTAPDAGQAVEHLFL